MAEQGKRVEPSTPAKREAERPTNSQLKAARKAARKAAVASQRARKK